MVQLKIGAIENWCLCCGYPPHYPSNGLRFIHCVGEPNLLLGRGQLLAYQGIVKIDEGTFASHLHAPHLDDVALQARLGIGPVRLGN